MLTYDQTIPLFVFEGIDHSGKTTISKKVHEKYNKLDYHWVWTKEPIFTSEMADKLNSADSSVTDAEREVMFLEGRLSQQTLYKSTPCFLDRYLWSGLAYAYAFSRSIYDFCIPLYQNYNIFKKPSITFFMDTPLDVCLSRAPEGEEMSIERLTVLKNAYDETKKYVNTPIVYLDGSKTIDELTDEVSKLVREYLIANPYRFRP